MGYSMNGILLKDSWEMEHDPREQGGHEFITQITGAREMFQWVHTAHAQWPKFKSSELKAKHVACVFIPCAPTLIGRQRQEILQELLGHQATYTEYSNSQQKDPVSNEVQGEDRLHSHPLSSLVIVLLLWRDTMRQGFSV